LDQDSDWNLDWAPVWDLGLHPEFHRRPEIDIARV
jgi:hypothetical protein